MQGKRKALIISISEYKDESLSQLDFCKNDGEEMYNTLINLGYEISENQKIVGKADKKTVEDAIFDFFRDKTITPSDTLLFYFSGHGVLDGYGGRFFASTDVSSSIPERNGIRFELLNEQMEKSNADKKIAILDCCFSGGAVPTLTGKAGDDLEKEAEDLGSEGLHKVFGKGQGSCILASSLSNKRSYSLVDKSSSAFSSFIIKGLKGNKESVDENGFVTPEKLSKYVFNELQKIPELENQKPVRNLSIAGDLILAEHKNLARKTSGKNVRTQDIDDMVKEAIAKQLQAELSSKSQPDQSAKKQDNPIQNTTNKPSINPKAAEGPVKQGYEYDKMGKFEEAIQMYDQALEINPLDVHALFNKGNSLFMLGRYPEALEYYDKALDIDPLDTNALNNKGNTLEKLGKPKKAIHMYEKAFEITPSDVTALVNKGSAMDQISQKLINVGANYVKKKIYYKKINQLYDKALEIEPNNISALIKKGEMMYRNKKYLESISHFNRVLSLDQSNVIALNFKGNVIALKEKRESGLAFFDKSIQVDPKNSWSFLCKGLAHMEFKQYDQAISSFDKALELDPNYSEAKDARKTAIKKNKKSRFPFRK